MQQMQSGHSQGISDGNPAKASNDCPLCGTEAILIFSEPVSQRLYLKGPHCELHFLRPEDHLSPEEERAHYDMHQNDVHDPRYQAFVHPLYQKIVSRLLPGGSCLDFGAGPGPVLTEMLRSAGHSVELYDPFYWPDEAPLQKTFDAVFACEVVEHFADPRAEFQKLFHRLKPGGTLSVMTLMVSAEVNFADWYYRRDPTHVVFYTPTTFAWIRDQFGYSGLTIDGNRIAVLTR